ncbi:hypothetical protein BJV74DRAFT_796569 [Russula compacta]|nr:hypothetical protein BJV74DRAFT_796569 [Russula compacta]
MLCAGGGEAAKVGIGMPRSGARHGGEGEGGWAAAAMVLVLVLVVMQALTCTAQVSGEQTMLLEELPTQAASHRPVVPGCIHMAPVKQSIYIMSEHLECGESVAMVAGAQSG